MDNLLKKIKELEREAQWLKMEEAKEKLIPSLQPLLRHWSLEKRQPECLSPPRPTAARSLKILESGLGAFPPARDRPFELEEPFEGDGDGNWLAAFKTEAGPWTGRKLVVLSLFDGIGGI